MVKLETSKPQYRFYWFLYKKRVKIMYENILFISGEIILTQKWKIATRKFSIFFFKTNTIFAKVEFVVNAILEYVSAWISSFFPFNFFDFCRFFNLCSFPNILIIKFRKISVRYSCLLFTAAYI